MEAIGPDEPELHYHAKLGGYLRVQSLVNEGVDPDTKDSYGRTPLMLAAAWSHWEIVEFLINSGADIHYCDISGSTALHFASLLGTVEIVQHLVNKGIAIDKKNLNGKTPLKLAVKFSNTEVVAFLINSGADIHSCDDDWTVLHHASYKGWVNIIQCLVTKGVSLDVKTKGCLTPLMLAASEAHSEVVEMLIKLGADFHCIDDGGWTALHHASCGGSVKIVQGLLDKGVAVDMKSTDGATPLMLATEEPRREVFELLINSGADIHCSDDIGRTVLHHASWRGSVKIVECLVNKGVALDIKNSKGVTPLMFAAEASHRDIVELLIKSNADIHCCDDKGGTVLHHAIDGGSMSIVQLISQEVDINARNSDGITPLHIAAELDEIEIADFLLKAGADCNLEDYEGESPFNILIRNNLNVEIIKLCIEKGAYVNSEDYNNLLGDPLLKKVILQDKEICSQAVINKFNNRDLPSLYEMITCAQKLPHIDKMKIGNRSGIVLEIEKAVTREIKIKGFCDLFEIDKSVLSILSVKSYIEKSSPAFFEVSPLESQNSLKRSLCYHEQEYPSKKMCN